MTKEKETPEQKPEEATDVAEEKTEEKKVEESSEGDERSDEGLEIDLMKASDIVRDRLIEQNSPWVFLFQIDSVKKNTADNIFIVKCSFFQTQGGYEKNHYIAKVNIRTGKIVDLSGFSFNIKTGEKKPLEVSPPE